MRELEEEAGIELPAGRAIESVLPLDHPGAGEGPLRHLVLRSLPRRRAPTPTLDGSECADARWIRPGDALDADARDELILVFPTIKHLEQLAAFDSLAAALDAARARRVMPVGAAAS